MKLAEALILRSDFQQKIEELKIRLLRNAKVQEGEKPSEEPKLLLKELDNCIEQLTSLVQKINKTNSEIIIKDVGTISDALALRDTKMLKRKVLSAFLAESSIMQSRYGGSEIKIHSTVNISDIQKQIDKLSQEYRIIDTKIQEQNWISDLCEITN